MLELLEKIKPYFGIILIFSIVLIVLIIALPRISVKKKKEDDYNSNSLKKYQLKDELNIIKKLNNYFDNYSLLKLDLAGSDSKIEIRSPKNYLKDLSDLNISIDNVKLDLSKEDHYFIEIINQLHNLINLQEDDLLDLASKSSEIINQQMSKCNQLYQEIKSIQGLIPDGKLNYNIEKCLNELDKSKHLRNKKNQQEYDYIYDQYLPQLLKLLRKFSSSKLNEKDKNSTKNHLYNVLKIITASLAIVNQKEDSNENNNSQTFNTSNPQNTKEYDLAKETREAIAISKNTYD